MSKIQNRLSALQPYVIGVRFQNDVSIVDAVFKKGWTVPKSEVILSDKGDSEDLNYHMFFSQTEGIGLDEILDHIEKIIGLNIEREKKHTLLKTKAIELQKLFKENPLSKLQTMRFVLDGEKLIEEMKPDELDVVDFVLDETVEVEEQTKRPSPQPSPQPVVQDEQPVVNDNVRRAPNGEIIPELAPEDNGEIDGDFKTFDLTPDEPPVTREVNGKSIDLPPKKSKPTIELDELDEPQNIVCHCDGPDEVCPACEETKVGTY